MPILDDVGFPATVFVPTDYPERPAEPMSWDGIDGWLGGPYERELRPMSWEQLGDARRCRLGDRVAHLLAPAAHDALR